jgi:tRNA (cmo5U34)-methyltransferase
MKRGERTSKGFDLLSPFYDASVRLFFGRSLWKAQSYFLSQLPRAKHTLIIGGGTGKILEEMMHIDISDAYCYADISAQMIRLTELRISKRSPESLSPVTFITGTVDDVPSSFSFDLIVTPYLLDMIPHSELLTEMKKMDRLLSDNGKWLFTDFNYPKEKKVMSSISKLVVKALYVPFMLFAGIRNSSLPDFSSAFSSLGYKAEKEKYLLGGMLVTRVYVKK